MSLPAFETPRLTLTPATRDDVDVLWAIWRDPDVRRYLFDDEPVTRERAIDVLERALAPAKDGLGLWLVRVHGDAAAVGAVALLPVHEAIVACDPKLEGAVEIVASFLPSVWSLGYAAEALEPLIHHGFTTCGRSELVAVVDVPNEASQRMVRRLGFTVTGEGDGPRYRMRTYALPSTRFPVQRVAAGR